MAASAEDQVRLLVSIEATQAKFVKQMDAIARHGGQKAKEIEGSFQAFDRTSKSARFAVQNLSFQLNDISTQLASGSSPFMVMAQQGGQVVQALSGAGGVINALRLVAAAAVNPFTIATVAVTAIAAASSAYFSGAEEGSKDANTLLQQHADIIKSFDAAYHIAAEGAKQYSDAVRNIELQKLKDEFEDTSEKVKTASKDIAGRITSLSVDDFAGATKAVIDFKKALTLLDGDAPDLRAFADSMATIEKQTGWPESVRALAKELRQTAQESLPLQDNVEEVQKRLDMVFLSGQQARQMFEQLTATMLGLGPAGGGAIDSIIGKFGELVPSIDAAIKKLGEYVSNYLDLQKMVEKTPLGTLAPLVSGGGQFLNPDQFNTFRASQSALDAAGNSSAAAMLKRFENFRSSAYYDVNAYRAGFGSDTTTRDNGMIEKVTKDTIVSLDDAERDLSRRIIEFQGGIQKAIGVDTWKSLNEAQQAALTSIAYNYGQLPKSIVAAIQGGGGPQGVAKAIAQLTSNPGRRGEEAQAYLSGTGISMSEAGLSAARKTPQQLFQGSLDDVQRRIDMLNAEYKAQAQLNPLVNDYGYAIEKARVAQQLLAEAQERGLDVTPELRASIEQLAGNYALAATQADQLRDSQERVAQAAAEMSDLAKEAVGGFIRDLIDGKDAAEAFGNALGRLGDRLIDSGLDAIFDPKGGIFGKGGILGGLGGLFFPGILHGGGIAGKDGYGHGRRVSPALFANAPRYHQGGIAGLRPGEVPAILKKGEPILPDIASLRGLAGRGRPETINVVLRDDSGRMAEIADQRIKTSAGTIVNIAVRRAGERVVPTVARYQNDRAGGDYRLD